MNKRPIGWRQVSAPPVSVDGSDETRKQLVDYLVRAGSQAPSWYNCQPWKFEVGENYISIVLDDSRDRSFFDWGHFNSLLACGAVVKNILIAAKGRCVRAYVEPFPDTSNPLKVAIVHFAFEDSDAPTENDLMMERAIWMRYTNTLFFENTPLTTSDLDALSNSMSNESGIGLHILDSYESKEEVFAAASTAELVRFSRRDLHQQLYRMIRWSERQAYADKTGCTLASIGACGFGKAFFWMTRPWIVMRLMNFFGAYRHQAKRACEGFKHCALIGLLTVKGHSPVDLLQAGQSMQQLWLVATILGLDLQPHNTVAQFYWAWKTGGRELYDSQEQRILESAFRSYEAAFPSVNFTGGEMGFFLFRVGKGESMQGYTLRKEVY